MMFNYEIVTRVHVSSENTNVPFKPVKIGCIKKIHGFYFCKRDVLRCKTNFVGCKPAEKNVLRFEIKMSIVPSRDYLMANIGSFGFWLTSETASVQDHGIRHFDVHVSKNNFTETLPPMYSF